MNTHSKEVVVLVHGLWMKGPELLFIRYRLMRQGYQVCQFHYPSIFKSPEQNAASLFQFVSKIDSPVVHFVAHSLGGIVLAHLFASYKIKQPGKVVLIGSPVNGSAAAAYLHNNKLMKFLLGKSVIKGLLGDTPKESIKRTVCVIAGTKGPGAGQLFAAKVMQKPHDGTVNLGETLLDNAAEFHTVPRSHFLLLVSNKVIKIIINFLEKE
ncbi:MAG: alpha/beta hydrolase [Gammaproteobacteria bacterium]|nr:alpha/beta hydrolase [Gammaproteobacteria bacterium]